MQVARFTLQPASIVPHDRNIRSTINEPSPHTGSSKTDVDVRELAEYLLDLYSRESTIEKSSQGLETLFNGLVDPFRNLAGYKFAQLIKIIRKNRPEDSLPLIQICKRLFDVANTHHKPEKGSPIDVRCEVLTK